MNIPIALSFCNIPPLVLQVMQMMAEVSEAIPMHAYRGGNTPVSYKSDGTPVTEVDSATEYKLIERLSVILPGSQTLGEETVGAGDAWKSSPLLQSTGEVWIVDPIDGTFHFARKEPFGMLIGLRQNGRMNMSIAYYPVEQEFLWASQELSGTFHTKIKNGHISPSQQIVIPQIDMQNMQLGYYMSHNAGGTIEDLQKIISPATIQKFGKGTSVDRCIATALRRILMKGDYADINGYCYSPWDFEVTASIARAAGAVVTHLDGTEGQTTPNAKDIIFTPSREISDEIHKGIKSPGFTS